LIDAVEEIVNEKLINQFVYIAAEEAQQEPLRLQGIDLAFPRSFEIENK
jgi:hypothetical protein